YKGAELWRSPTVEGPLLKQEIASSLTRGSSKSLNSPLVVVGHHGGGLQPRLPASGFCKSSLISPFRASLAGYPLIDYKAQLGMLISLYFFPYGANLMAIFREIGIPFILLVNFSYKQLINLGEQLLIDLSTANHKNKLLSFHMLKSS